jgi:hypothetical protein
MENHIFETELAFSHNFLKSVLRGGEDLTERRREPE